jgi:hypothetical protein
LNPVRIAGGIGAIGCGKEKEEDGGGGTKTNHQLLLG